MTTAPFSDIKKIYEDKSILVLNKPHGLLTIPDRYDPDIPNLRTILGEKYPKIFIVHRLDFGTAGIMVFAKDADSHRILNGQFEKHTVEKEYMAVVDGTKFKPLTVMLPVSQKNSHGRYKINFKSGKKAVTSFFPISENKGLSLVKAFPLTGRTHQIRIHLKSIRYPLTQDFLYNKKIEDKRLTLLCSSLKFKHPGTGEDLTFTAELTEFMKKIYD